MSLTVGARFASFKDLEAAILKFSDETNAVYTIYNSRSIEAENRQRPSNKQLPTCLKYKHIKFACKHYGALRSKSRGIRPRQSTFKIGCPSFIYASVHHHQLVVEKLELNHTHLCDPELVVLYPERRSLANIGNDTDNEEGSGVPASKSVREDVIDLLTIGVERRRIKNYVTLRTGRIMLTGDLSNLAKCAREQSRKISPERTEQLLEHLKLVESKENKPQPVPKELSSREKFNALKRRIPISTYVKSEREESCDASEHCYSLMTTGPPLKKQHCDEVQEGMEEDNYQDHHMEEHHTNENEMEASNVGDVQEHIHEGNVHQVTWNENTSLEDVVKSILGPEQDGPVIVHVNNYEGVAVVEVLDAKDNTNLGQVSLQTAVQTPEKINEPVAADSDVQPVVSPRKLVSVKKNITNLPSTSTSSKTPNLTKPCHKTPTKSVDDAPNAVIAPKLPCKSSPRSKSESTPIGSDLSYHEEYYNDDHEYSDEIDGYSELDTEQDSRLMNERRLVEVKTEKYRLQIRHLRNDIEKQELEKEKLRLEIRLLGMQVEAKEREKKRGPR